MKTFPRFSFVALCCAVTAALAGCATVDLGPDMGAPQVRMPGDVSSQPPPPAPAPPLYQSAQTIPVAPGGPVAQPLPPPGSTVDDVNVNVSGSASDAGVPAADARLMTLSTRLDGVSAVPPTSSGATAQIDLLYDAGTRLLRWKAEWINLSSPITAVRFYGPAAQGQQGPATLIWPGPFGPRYEGRATITLQQATDLMGGLWYVNIQTMNYPEGEIRGQLRVVY